MTVQVIDSESSVLQAIYTALTANETISSAVTGVFTQVPKGQAVPFITIGSATTLDNSTTGTGGQVITLNLHIWDQNYSSATLLTLKAAVISVLHDQTLNLNNGSLVNVNTRYVNSQTLKDSDGLTQQVVIRFRIVVQNNS